MRSAANANVPPLPASAVPCVVYDARVRRAGGERAVCPALRAHGLSGRLAGDDNSEDRQALSQRLRLHSAAQDHQVRLRPHPKVWPCTFGAQEGAPDASGHIRIGRHTHPSLALDPPSAPTLLLTHPWLQCALLGFWAGAR